MPSPSAGLSISEDSHQTTAHTPDWPLAPSERTGPHTPASHTPTESYARLAGGHRVYSAIGSNHISRDDEEDGDEVEGETLGPPDSLLSPLTAIKTNVPMSLMRSKLTSEKLRRKVINQSRRINRNFRMVGLLSEANTPNGPGVASEEAPVQGSIPGSRPTRHTPTRPPALLPGKSKKVGVVGVSHCLTSLACSPPRLCPRCRQTLVGVVSPPTRSSSTKRTEICLKSFFRSVLLSVQWMGEWRVRISSRAECACQPCLVAAPLITLYRSINLRFAGKCKLCDKIMSIVRALVRYQMC